MTKFGEACVPKSRLKMSMQCLPQDGVAAAAVPAVSAPAAPTPPTKVSVAAAASTLLLMDMDSSLLGTHSRTLRTAVAVGRRSARVGGSDPLGMLPARGGLIRTGTADLTGLAVQKGEDSGQARKLDGYCRHYKGRKLSC